MIWKNQKQAASSANSDDRRYPQDGDPRRQRLAFLWNSHAVLLTCTSRLSNPGGPRQGDHGWLQLTGG